jgi:hypothetical protein
MRSTISSEHDDNDKHFLSITQKELTLGSQMAVWRCAYQAQEPAAFWCKEIFLYVSGTHFNQRMSKPLALVRLEGLDTLIKTVHLIRSRIRDLPARSVLP